MLRRTLLFCVILPLAWLRLSSAATLARPSFIVIFTDDQTWRAIGYQNRALRTPALNQLAADGLVLDNAYVASPVCGASRASILTSLFPQQHECICLNTGPFIPNIRNGTYRCLPQYLDEADYVTGLCGKSHLGDPQKYGFRSGQEYTDVYDEDTFAFAGRFLNERAKDRRPFLLWIAPRQPHVPLKPAKKWRDLYEDVPLVTDPNFLVHPPPGSLYNQGLPGESYYRDSNFTDNFEQLPAGPPRSREKIRRFMLAYYATISHLDHQVGEGLQISRAA